MIKNALSVDLESFIHRKLNVKDRIVDDDGYTVSATEYLLDLFDKYDTKVTFFVLGEIYEWYPQLIEEIKKRGHEIGYHGHRHVILSNEKILLDDLNKSSEFLKKYKPIGFRAPRMFIKESYLRILSEAGFKYDSSTYGYGIEVSGYGIKEIPVSVFNYFSNYDNRFPQNITKGLLMKALPFGSGLFMSLFQKRVQYFISNANRNNKSANLFIHPWQLFDHETDSLPFMQKLLYRQKVNKTLEYLLRKNKFYPLKELL